MSMAAPMKSVALGGTLTSTIGASMRGGVPMTSMVVGGPAVEMVTDTRMDYTGQNDATARRIFETACREAEAAQLAQKQQNAAEAAAWAREYDQAWAVIRREQGLASQQQ